MYVCFCDDGSFRVNGLCAGPFLALAALGTDEIS